MFAGSELLNYGVLGIVVVLLIDATRRRIARDRRRLRRYEKFARREISKGDVGDRTLALLDEEETELPE